MRAVLMSGYGGTDVLYIGETESPVMGEGDLLIRVHATALNRADLLQRRGLYPPPKGASDVLGLEVSGEVVNVGRGVRGWNIGDKVCALVPGGGYAEYAVVPAGMAMRLPEGFTYEQGAAIPEVFLTAYLNLFWLGGLTEGKTVLIHAGASGVGTAAIQLVREAGAVAFITAGSENKVKRCIELGAKAGWIYKEGTFVPWIHELTQGRGVDIILDFVGASYFEQNLDSLAVDGRLIIVGTMGGAKVTDFNLGRLLAKRQQIIGTALRSRSVDDKIRLTQAFWEFASTRFKEGRLQPVIDSVFDWNDVAKAHAYMESNANIGKIILKIT
jgi:tumor protein p53-inducible protein 3